MTTKQRLAWASIAGILALVVATVLGYVTESSVAETAIWALAGIAVAMVAPGTLEKFIKLRKK